MTRHPVRHQEQQGTTAGMTEPGTAPGASGGADSRSSLLFSLDDWHKLDVEAKPDVDFDVTLEVARIKTLCCHNQAEQQLAAAVQQAKQEAGGTIDLWQLGVLLRSRHGYLVRHRKANMRRRSRAYLRQLRHAYLVVNGLEGQEGADTIVDLNFKDHFALPHSRPWYEALLAAVPRDWVGSAEGAASVARLLAAGMRLVFLQLGQPLPPWRERRALLSKWLPEVVSDEPIPLQPLPDQNAGIAAMLAPYQRSFRASLASIMCGATPAAAAVSSSIGQPQQHLLHNSTWPAARLEQQGAAGEGFAAGQVRPAGCLHAAAGRPATGVSLLRSALAQTPQKVVIGFPEQQQGVPLLPPQQHQQQQQQQWHHGDDQADRRGLWDAPCKRAHAPGSPRSPPPGSPKATVLVEVELSKGKAATAAPAGRAVFSINVAAAAASAAFASSAEVAEMDQTVRNGGRAAMATTQLAGNPSKGTAGLVATQQQQEGGAAAAALEVQAANAAASAGMAATATAAGVAAAAAAAAASSGVATRPGFKSLDQLLPRMRTVRPRAQ